MIWARLNVVPHTSKKKIVIKITEVKSTFLMNNYYYFLYSFNFIHKKMVDGFFYQMYMQKLRNNCNNYYYYTKE